MKSYEENGMCIRRGEIEHNSLCRRRRHNSSSGWPYTYSWALGGGGEGFFIATICCCCESVILLHSGFLSSVNLLGISIMNFIVKSTGFSCRMFLLDFILMAVQIHVLSHMSCLHPPLVSVLLHFTWERVFPFAVSACPNLSLACVVQGTLTEVIPWSSCPAPRVIFTDVYCFQV